MLLMEIQFLKIHIPEFDHPFKINKTYDNNFRRAIYVIFDSF